MLLVFEEIHLKVPFMQRATLSLENKVTVNERKRCLSHSRAQNNSGTLIKISSVLCLTRCGQL